jgi:hypothetical protein
MVKGKDVPVLLTEHHAMKKVLVRRLEGNRPLEKPRRRWEDNIKMDLMEIVKDGANWIRLA